MRGKVKYVTRSVWYEERQEDSHRHDVHPRRVSCTSAVLYNGDYVCIDEDEIRDYYDSSRLTSNIIGQLSEDLHNVWIEYYDDCDEDYWLDGCLSDYI